MTMMRTALPNSLARQVIFVISMMVAACVKDVLDQRKTAPLWVSPTLESMIAKPFVERIASTRKREQRMASIPMMKPSSHL